jgi:hypothetical protein
MGTLEQTSVRICRQAERCPPDPPRRRILLRQTTTIGKACGFYHHGIRLSEE